MKNLLESLKYQPVELKFGTSGLRALVAEMTDLEVYINTLGFIDFLDLTPGVTVYVAGDLRDSTPRITKAVLKAITDSGSKFVFGGFVPTPAVALYGLLRNSPSIMVTGSHIPADRNGIKFYKAEGEVLKSDERSIKDCVAKVRSRLYAEESEDSAFNSGGLLKERNDLPQIDPEIEKTYKSRFINIFDGQALAGKHIVFYQHSAVGRDLIPEILEAIGAKVTKVDKSDTFLPIDTENVTAENQAYFKSLARKYPDAFAIISTDGDSDRPFVIDENGIFHRGDELGAVVANWLKADFCTIPISTNDGVDTFLKQKNIEYVHTKIGSPYVIEAMQASDAKTKVGWEVNGGFLTGSEIEINGKQLSPLPTRDALLPIVGALVRAADSNQKVSEVFEILPKRFTQAGLLDDFPVESSKEIIEKLSGPSGKEIIEKVFTTEFGFSEVKDVNTLDGVRIFFTNGDIAHLRPSGNAPQMRVYSVANSQERADDIAGLVLKEPNGILKNIEL